jgi:short-subunit dehydrogenase
MPGPVETEFFERADMDQDTKVGSGDKDDPADVARDGFEAMMNGDERVVSHSLKPRPKASAAASCPTASRPRCTETWPNPARRTRAAKQEHRTSLRPLRSCG